MENNTPQVQTQDTPYTPHTGLMSQQQNISTITGLPVVKTDTTEFIANDIRSKVLQQGNTDIFFQSEQEKRQKLSSAFTPKKASTTNYNVTLGEAYKNIGGTYYSKYPNFISGTDNEERFGQQQSTASKWGRGLVKLVGKTGTAVLGGTLGQVSGLSNFISDGFKMDSLYQDDFNKWLDDLNEKMDYKLPNYYTAQERDMNFGQSLGTANFWANDLTQGLSFTLGMIVSEGIWAFATGGTSIATAGARWSLRAMKAKDISKGINNYSKLSKELLREGLTKAEVRSVIRGKKIGEGLNTARFTYTSAGYEAGVEARHMYKEAEENFLYNFEQANGRKPNAQEMAEFNELATKASNAVYAGNVAVVGGSNLAIFGRMFNTKLPSIAPTKKYFDKKLFGIGTETTEAGVRTAVKATRGQKIAGKAYGVLRPVSIEAFWEEGNQSVMGNAANAWVEAGYDIDGTNETLDMMGAVYEGFAETYSSKEGWKEIGLGAIIGLIGGGMSGTFMQDSRKRKQIEAYGEKLDNGYAADRFTKKLVMMNRIKKAGQVQEMAENKGDLSGAELARKQALIAQIDFQNEFGMLEEGAADFEAQLRSLDDAAFAEESGVTVEEVGEFKTKLLEDYKNTQAEYTQNKEFADAILGQGRLPQQLQDEKLSKEIVAKGIAYNLTMGKGAAQLSGELLNEMVLGLTAMNVDSSTIKALGLDQALSIAETETKQEFNTARSEATSLRQKRKDLTAEIKRETQNMNAAEEKGAYQARLMELSTQLEQAEAALTEAKGRMDVALNAMKMQNPYQSESDIIMAEEVLDLYESTTTVKDGKTTTVKRGVLEDAFKAIEKLKNSNPKEYQRYTKLYNEYKKSQYALIQYNKTIQGLTSDSFDLKEFTTKLGYKLFKGKDVNDFTKEFFVDIGTQMIQAETTLAAELIQDAAAIDEQTAQENGDTPSVTPLTPQQVEQLQSLEKEKAEALKALEKGTKNDARAKEIQDKISEIDGKITSLQQTQPNQEQIDEVNQRRQEELGTKESRSYTDDSGTTWTVEIQTLADKKVVRVRGEKDGETVQDTPNTYSKELSNDKIYEAENADEYTYGDVVQVEDRGGKRTDAINAKYDAEIATLQQQSPEAQQLEKEKSELQGQLENLQKQAPQETAEEIETRFATRKAEILKPAQPTPIQQLEKQIADMLKKHSPIADYIGENQSEAQANKPTQQEVEEYQELLGKQNQSTMMNTNLADALETATPQELKDLYGDNLAMTLEEVQRFEELNNKMASWYLMEGTMVGETSLADLIERLEILKRTPETANVKRTVTRRDAFEIEEASEKQAKASRNSKEMVQNPTGVYTKVHKNKRRELNHLTVRSIVERLLPNVNIAASTYKATPKSKPIGLDTLDFEKVQKNQGGVFTIELENGEKISIDVGEHSKLFLTEADWSKIQNDFGVKFFTAEGIDPNTSILGYEVKEDGSIVPAKSDFTIDTTLENRPEEMVAEEMHNLKPGDKVDLYLDPLNTYNAQLVDNLRKAEKSKNQEAIDKAKQELDAQAVIYIMHNGKIVGQLRGGLDGIDTTRSKYENYKNVRTLAGNTLNKAQGENLINLKTSIEVNFVFNGSPIFQATVDESGNLQLNSLPITNKVVSLLLDAGYVENGQVFIGGKVRPESVQTTYLPNTSAKTPIVIFKHRGENVAFPVSLIEVSSNLADQVYNILDGNLPIGKKINEINKVLLENGIDPKTYNITEQNIGSAEVIDSMLESLGAHRTIPNVETWAERGFDLNNLQQQAEISIDLENSPFNTPKVKLDLVTVQSATVQEGQNQNADQVVYESVEDAQIQLEEELSNELIEIERLENAENVGKDETAIMEFFGDNTVLREKDIENHAQKLSNKNTLVAFLNEFPQGRVPKHLKQKVAAVRNKVKKYEKLVEKKGAIKNTALKNQTNNVKKTCK